MPAENNLDGTEKPGTRPTQLSLNGITVLPEITPDPDKIKSCLQTLANHSSPEISEVYGEVLTKLQS